jgi:hypothetical protein
LYLKGLPGPQSKLRPSESAKRKYPYKKHNDEVYFPPTTIARALIGNAQQTRKSGSQLMQGAQSTHSPVHIVTLRSLLADNRNPAGRTTVVTRLSRLASIAGQQVAATSRPRLHCAKKKFTIKHG